MSQPRTPALGRASRAYDAVRRLPGPAIAAIVAVAYFTIAQYVIWLNDPVNAGAGYWPAAGVTLAALVIVPVRRWPWVLGAVVVAEVGGDALHDYPLASSAWWAVGNAIEPLTAALVLRRVGGGGRLAPVADLVWFLVAGVLVGPMVGAAVGSVGTAAEYGNAWGDVFVKWWAGDGLGVLVVAPLLLCFREPRGVRRSRREALLLAAAAVVVPALAFHGWHHEWDIALPYVVFPLVMWASVRFGVRGAAVVGFAVAETANLANALGYGPFGTRGDEGQAKTILQMFLGSALTAGLVIAALVLDAVRRARVYEAQRAVADVLQAAVLPKDLPVVAGLTLAARYVPVVADDVSHVGGDWYDAFTVASGDLTVVIGDVSGHDLPAALVMGQVRNGLRTLFVEHDDPARALTVIDRQLALDTDGPIATAVCVRYRRDGELIWTSAGHPPLLVLRRDGTARFLEGAPGPVLGVGVGGYVPHVARLEPGDQLIAFTDGVVEHRGWSLDEGFEHLRRLAEVGAQS